MRRSFWLAAVGGLSLTVGAVARPADKPEKPAPAAQPAQSAPEQAPWANKFFLPDVASNREQPPPAVITHNFGEVPHGTLCVHKFTITNVYDVPMQITDVRKSCTCLDYVPVTKTLQPNETAEFTITMNSGKFVGHNSQTFYVTFGPKYVSTAVIRVSATSRADVSLNPGSVAFGTVPQGARANQSISVKYSGRSRDWKLTEVLPVTGPFDVRVSEASRGGPLRGGAEYQVEVTLKADAPSGPINEQVSIRTTDANHPVVTIAVVLNVADRANAKPLGFIPTGWYPTCVRFNPKDKNLYFANGKGMSSKANRSGPNPTLPRARNINEYIGQLFTGTLGIMKVPTPEAMATYTKQAYACSPLRDENAVRADNVEPDNPIPKKLGDPSPIKYVIYIIKENRTYDQVLGDLAAGPNPKGNGEPELCLFPRDVTPNHHKLAEEFVLLDNFYVDGEVSADGHEWSMGAYATDFVEKIWPLSYRGGKVYGYPSEGAKDLIARPSGGYIWDRCIEAKVSVRSYGEWVNNVGEVKPDLTFADGKAAVKALEGRFDPQYRSYDLNYPDVKRAERFISEFKRLEKAGQMPQLQIVKLPNDHTAGTAVGKPTVRAMVADNDLALGMIVEAVTNSSVWKETAIFVVEDDTQNGPDHVDAHRSVAFVISPYTKRKHVDSTLYSTTSMLRTMELILNLQPMSQFDAAARPMYASFTSKPDATPYKHEVPKVDLKELNKPGGFGQAWLEKEARAGRDQHEDRLDDLIFSEIIWKAVKGEHSPMPPPVRAAFFVPVKAGKKDDDD